MQSCPQRRQSRRSFTLSNSPIPTVEWPFVRSLLISGTVALDTLPKGTWTFFGVCRATVSSLRANCSGATSATSGKALRSLTRNTRKTTSRSPSSLSQLMSWATSAQWRWWFQVRQQNCQSIHKVVGGFPPQGKIRRRRLSSALQPAHRHPVRVPSGARQR